jgi:hypothetical protein
MNTIRHLSHVTTIAACLAAAIVAGKADAATVAPQKVVQMPTVQVIGQRQPAVVQLPMVTVVAKRSAAPEAIRVAYLPTVTVMARREAAEPVMAVAQLPTVTVIGQRLPATTTLVAEKNVRLVPAQSDV